MYGANPRNGYAREEIADFNNADRNFDVWRIARLDNGSYVGARGDFQYGLIAIDSKGNVSDWPLGYDFETPETPRQERVSSRSIAYCKEKGIVAEIYGCLPAVILHDENGKVVKTIDFKGYNPVVKDEGEPSECFTSVALTPEYIWLLKGDKDVDKDSRIIVIDYDANPIVSLSVPFAQTMAIDTKNNRIITVDANQEDRNVMLFEIPDFIKK